MLALHCHHLGVETRLLAALPPFLFARVVSGGEQLPCAWRCSELTAYARTGRRSSPLFGWLEWVDTRELPAWREPAFDDSAWGQPLPVEPPIAVPVPLETDELTYTTLPAHAIGSGALAWVMREYPLDDPPLRFFATDLDPDPLAAEGAWLRFDTGRVCLGRPAVTLDVPAGTVVEMGSSEVLTRGRVVPVYPLSTGPTCTVDRWIARGGPQVFQPLHPRGLRYLELQVAAPPQTVRVLDAQVQQRAYYGAVEGGFTCDDALLERIWEVGVATLDACAEDALVDCPTRERGQWLGDVATVGMEIASVAHLDLRLFARGLRQAAWCADERGIPAGLCPGNVLHLTTYGLQWVTACLRYHELTGDTALLEELLPHARRLMRWVGDVMTPGGIDMTQVPWAFIDWGYVARPPGGDMALTLHALLSARDLERWASRVDQPSGDAADVARRAEDAVRGWLAEHAGDWSAIGYHCAALALRAGLLEDDAPAAVEALKAHLVRCFPNDPRAPRNSSPDTQRDDLITPYFAHYAFPELIERGETDFVLQQYRTCWGWMLEQGATTWLEVFDTNWSWCHQWAGSPTWQLSRHVLGLWHRFDRGARHFDVRVPRCGDLRRAGGRFPAAGGAVDVSWTRDGDALEYVLTSESPVTLRLPGGETVRDVREWRGVLAATP